jgi:molybdopterin/thiamine biosynthesis adenylyltransferase
VALDGCDNFATRLAVSDACVAAGVPLTSAALGRFQGQIANFAGHRAGHACYRCFVGDAFDAELRHRWGRAPRSRSGVE